MKKALTITIILALAILMLPLSALAVNVNNGVYVPMWTPEWVNDETRGMWQGFYIKDADNTLKIDLVKKSSAEWGIPGVQFGVIWEGEVNACAPADEADVGYMFTAVEGGKVEFTVKCLLEVPGCTDVEFAIYKGNFSNKIWPQDSAVHTMTSGQDVNVNFAIDLKKDEKVFFRFHSPVEVADSPLVRFREFRAVWRSVDGGGVTSPDVSIDVDTPSTPNNDTTPSTPNNDTTSSTPSGEGDIIIDTDNSFYLTPKYQDVKVDEESNTITLEKKLTYKDFMESFVIKSGYTITVKDSETTKEVTDNDTVITDKMLVTVFNSGTPINSMKIVTKYAADAGTSNDAGSSSNALVIVLIVVLAVVVLALAAVLVYFLVIKKKNNVE
ncbi:MAG: hypothetical protein E7480_01025 [Ruminococcaceae bacterium]|nr:hypothetical protein [Oscillospiraceae bacterium]